MRCPPNRVNSNLLILDDLFLARRITPDAADHLRPIIHWCSKRRRNILIIPNRIIADWPHYLGEIALATSILHCLMHRGMLIEFKGRSYRIKEASQRLATNASDE
jgi:DNA replication protein DnaC